MIDFSAAAKERFAEAQRILQSILLDRGRRHELGMPDELRELDPKEGPACPGCGRVYDRSGHCACGYEERLRRFEQRDEPQPAEQVLDEFRRRMVLVVEREWPKEDLLEDWPKKLLAPLVWLGMQTLERTAPQDRRRTAEEFIHSIGARAELVKVSVPQKNERWWVLFDVRSGEPSSSRDPAVAAEIYRPHGFLEQELARLPSHSFPQDLRSSRNRLLLLCRLHQAWFEKQLGKQLQAAIRKIGRREADARRRTFPLTGALLPVPMNLTPQQQWARVVAACTAAGTPQQRRPRSRAPAWPPKSRLA
jgi:hypothetical protein